MQDSSVAQFIRYAAVGVASNLAAYIVFLAITFIGVEHKAAMSLLYLTVAAAGFFGNRKWTFSHHGNLLSAGARYVMVHACGYAINLALLMTFVDTLGYSYKLIQAIAIFVVAGFLFFAFRYFVFRDTSGKKMGNQ